PVMPAAGVGWGDAVYRRVRTFGATGGEGDLAGPGAQDPRDPTTGVLDRAARCVADLVRARRVAEVPRQVRPHGLEHLTAHGRGGGQVEVDHDTRTSSPRSRLRAA